MGLRNLEPLFCRGDPVQATLHHHSHFSRQKDRRKIRHEVERPGNPRAQRASRSDGCGRRATIIDHSGAHCLFCRCFRDCLWDPVLDRLGDPGMGHKCLCRTGRHHYAEFLHFLVSGFFDSEFAYPAALSPPPGLCAFYPH